MTHHDPLWMKMFLTVHVAAGATSFLLAPVALATAKGGKQHKRWGMVYLWAMGVVAGTALPMALYRPVLFLALVAVFSFYAAFSGYRVLKLKNLASGGSARPIDWAAGVFTFGASACLAAFGAFRPAWVQHAGIVAIVFGFVGMNLAFMQMLSFVRKPKEKMFWLYTHFGNFIGSYIAAWTAFSVVTISPLLHNYGAMAWLWPTAIGTPAITLTTIYYKRKCAESEDAGWSHRLAGYAGGTFAAHLGHLHADTMAGLPELPEGVAEADGDADPKKDEDRRSPARAELAEQYQHLLAEIQPERDGGAVAQEATDGERDHELAS